ncbi:MutS family DNA mismatch repair protein [Sessilibacter sp. MAH1]
MTHAESRVENATANESSKAQQAVIDQIEAKRDFYQAQIEQQNKQLALLSKIRVTLFLGFIGPLAFLEHGLFLVIPSVISLVLFIVIVRRYQKINRNKNHHCDLLAINQRTLARICRDWTSLDQAKDDTDDAIFWHDLNIGGTKSFLSLINCISSPLGFSRIKAWLKEPARTEVIYERQAAQQALKTLLDFRQHINALGLKIGEINQLTLLTQWLKTQPQKGRASVINRRLLLAWNLLGLGAIGASAFSIISPLLPSLYVLGNIVLIVKNSAQVKNLYFHINIKPEQINGLKELSASIEQLSTDNRQLKDLQAQLSDQDGHFSQSLERLHQLILLSELRLNVIPYAVISLLVCWDLHVLLNANIWADRFNNRYETRLRAVADFEALATLAALAYENPSWTLPTIENNLTSAIVIENGAHPLLAANSAVTNSFELTQQQRVCVITGSHMSGKTTFLRTIGVNAKLAMIGSVVCASRLSMPRIEVLTSMHISDSLLDGVSLFMAEVIKIKAIIEKLERIRSENDTNTLFLLDEVLRGSNDLERKFVFVELLKKLETYGGYGLISTNDISIARSSEVDAIVEQYHFQESLSEQNHGVNFEFDYKLRPGLVSKTNALHILKSMAVV